MQFALLDSKICLAYFKGLFLLISVRGHTRVCFPVFPHFLIHIKVSYGSHPLMMLHILFFRQCCARCHNVVPLSHALYIVCILYGSGLNIFVALYLVYNVMPLR